MHILMRPDSRDHQREAKCEIRNVGNFYSKVKKMRRDTYETII